MRPTPAILEVRRLRVERGGTVILRDLDWRVSAGEHWVILGANGSGKTSLLTALTGYLTPTAGEMELLGHRYGETDWRELRRRVGLVSSAIRQRIPDDESTLATVLSGPRAMIQLWGRTTSAERRAARRILERVECLPLAARPWGVLSQGERQRVLIGRALMARPRLLILDEPCAGLDPVARERFLRFLDRLGRQRGAPALVLVTHHVEEIMPVFTHALLLRQGRALAAGRMSAVLTSARLTRAFGAGMRVRRSRGRYLLCVAARRGAVL
jgi:iron complex transport system ATP-binding protein